MSETDSLLNKSPRYSGWQRRKIKDCSYLTNIRLICSFVSRSSVFLEHKLCLDQGLRNVAIFNSRGARQMDPTRSGVSWEGTVAGANDGRYFSSVPSHDDILRDSIQIRIQPSPHPHPPPPQTKTIATVWI